MEVERWKDRLQREVEKKQSIGPSSPDHADFPRLPLLHISLQAGYPPAPRRMGEVLSPCPQSQDCQMGAATLYLPSL